MRGQRSRWSVGHCAVAGVVVLAAWSLPTATRTEVSKSITLSPATYGEVGVSCPHGEHVAFGGYFGDYRQTSLVSRSSLVMGMWPDTTTKWSVSGYENESPAAKEKGTLTSIGYCEKGAAPTIVKGATVKVAADHTGAALAQCPRRTVVVGDGFSITKRSGFGIAALVTELHRTSSRVIEVSVLAYNDSSVTAYALCGAGAAPVETVVTQTMAARGGGSVAADCPSGKSLVFGGLSAQDGEHAPSPAVFPFSMKATAAGLAVSGYNASLTTPGGLTAISYCR